MAITDWPTEQRPRERLLAQGPAALSDAELVALFLRTGIAGKNAIELARELIGVCGGLNGLLSADRTALWRVKGLGSAKVAQLSAVLELARRCLGEQLRSGAPLNSPSAVRDYLQLALGSREHEVFLALFVDAQHRVLSAEELFRGTLTQTSVYPREVVKAALRANAAAVIFAHNHPSGVAQPSQADELLTRSLKDALALVEVKVLDHFIVAGRQTLSFAERGLL
ncbi:MAG TPA: DNA repair protein RadC [Burkholderiales bacterium]|nr:DNA repair protein RadC [Burkholderiales bacterium]HYA46403.1 DNA repair protein RadC [Burkholderiales bacterium]